MSARSMSPQTYAPAPPERAVTATVFWAELLWYSENCGSPTSKGGARTKSVNTHWSRMENGHAQRFVQNAQRNGANDAGL